MSLVCVLSVLGLMDVDEHYEFQECTSKDVRDVVGDDLDDEWGISEMHGRMGEGK